MFKKGNRSKCNDKRTAIGNAINQSRFSSMTLQEFGQITSQSSMLSSEEMVLFYEKFSEVERASEVSETLLRCCRFVEYTSSWGREDKHILYVSFNKTVKIHGVRLLGRRSEKYDLKLKIFSHILKKGLKGKTKEVT